MQFYNKKKILILGGTGFIGKNLIIKLQSYDCKIISTFNKKKPKFEYNNNKVKFIKSDLTLSNARNKNLFKSIDYVFMCAAVTSGAKTIEKKPLDHLTPNLIMNAKVLEWAYEMGVKKVCFISSSTVYPNLKKKMSEKDIDYNFFEKYFIVGWMKLFSEKMCTMYDSRINKKMKTQIIRPSNLYGPHDKFDPELSKVIPSLIRKSLVKDGRTLEVWGDGKDIKDFLYIDDFIEALVKIFPNDKVKVINICFGKSFSLRDIIKIIIKNINPKIKVKYNSNMPSMIPVRNLSNLKIKKMIKWKPKTSLEIGIKKTIQWYLKS